MPTPSRSSPLPDLPLSQIIAEYQRDLQRRGIARKTIVGYAKILSLALHAWTRQLEREPRLSDFGIPLAERFLDHLLERGHATNGKPLAPETLRTYVRTLKVFAAWLAAEKQRLTSDDRLKLLPLPRKPHTFKQPLDTAEMQALLAVCATTTVLGSRDLAMLLTFLDGGLRASELIHLTVGDVNVESGQVFIASGKGQKSRVVTLGDDTRRILRRYAFFRDASQSRAVASTAAFFQTDQGTVFSYEGLRNWMCRLRAKAGVPRAFIHLLRHTSAVRALDAGSDVFTLQSKLGHADLATTRRYLTMTSEQLSARQKSFSPIDHLGLSGLMRLAPPEKERGYLWRQTKKRAKAADQ